MQQSMFINDQSSKGAIFSENRKHRFVLWRIWDDHLPKVMFIGLNPSTANETQSDPTIRSVQRIAKSNGYGGFYMTNCWTYISTDPNKVLIDADQTKRNNEMLNAVAVKCKDIVFAWGNFNIVREHSRDTELRQMFPNAKVLGVNKNCSPKHPLYCKSDTAFIDIKHTKIN